MAKVEIERWQRWEADQHGQRWKTLGIVLRGGSKLGQLGIINVPEGGSTTESFNGT